MNENPDKNRKSFQMAEKLKKAKIPKMSYTAQ